MYGAFAPRYLESERKSSWAKRAADCPVASSSSGGRTLFALGYRAFSRKIVGYDPHLGIPPMRYRSLLVIGVVLLSACQAGAQGTAGIRFVKWTEPKEHSFSLEIPSGWSVESGVNWLGQIDPQRYIRLQSPNKKITVFFGDPELLIRQVPTAAGRMQAGNVKEGQVFRSPSGGPAMLQRFMTGEEYAKAHTTWRTCPSPNWVMSREDQEMSRAMADAVAPEARRFNLVPEVRSGEATYTCGKMQGATQATTILIGKGGPIQMWMVYRVGGFLSNDPLQSMQARYVMEHVAATFKDDPRWIAEVDRRATELTGAVMNMQNAAVQASLAASRQQNETLSRLNRPNTYSPSSRARSSGSSASGKDVNTTLGTARVCDAIGRCSTVSTSSDSHYMDHSGNVRSGTTSGAPPDKTGVWSRLY